MKKAWLVLGSVSTGENDIVASRSWEGETETNALNSASGKRGGSNWCSGGGVFVGDARGLGGENNVASLSIHSSVCCAGIDDAVTALCIQSKSVTCLDPSSVAYY